MAIYDIKELKHDPNLANALGNMVVAWAHAETVLTGTLARVCGIDINMAMLGYYRIPTFEARVKYLNAIMLEWNPKAFDKAAISKEIESTSAQAAPRNKWVHNLWCHDRDANETIIFDFRREGDKRRKPVKSADVANHIEALLGHADKLAKLIKYSELTDHGRQQPTH